MTYILGISGLYHDSAACLIRDGEIVAAVQEERFTRKKHDARIPVNAMRYCLQSEGLSSDDLEAVVYYDNPLLVMERFLYNAYELGQNSGRLIDSAFERLVSDKLWIHESIKNTIGGLGKCGKLLVCKHHISHAASAFYPSPYDEAAILTIDGVGEWTTTALGVGRNERVSLVKEIRYPHSLGLFYSAFTYFCGFKVNSGDYKFMGLAPYGNPVYYNLIKERIIDIRPDGSYRLHLEYFDYYKGGTMINEERFSNLFGGPRRTPEEMITQREMDIAASVQMIIEEVIINLAKEAKSVAGQNVENLVIAGGVGLNCVANGKLEKSGLFKNIWIQPAAGDAGGALGAALFAYYYKFGGKRKSPLDDSQKGSFLGPQYSEEIYDYLRECKIPFHKIDDNKEWAKYIANCLKEKKVVGLFKGRMEFGPRALGNRSIIADCRSEDMQTVLNLKIKYRESFRPFAPVVLEEDLDKYFDLGCESPYMLKVGYVKNELRKKFDLGELLEKYDGDMLKVVSTPRSSIPAVTHVDYSARIQTVDGKRNKELVDIMREYRKMTGCSVLVNTSFNVRGEPIVCTPKDAYLCFMRTQMDVLVLENFVLIKEEQPTMEESEDWIRNYELD